MIQNLKLYFAFLGASLKKMMEYRVDFLIGTFSQLTFQIIELIFIWIIFQNTDNIAGWNFQQLLLLYGVMMLALSVNELLFDSTYDIGRKFIRKGKFDTILLRPVHPLISVLGESQSSSSMSYVILSVILIVTMLIKLEISITFWLVQTIFSVSGFWTYKSNEVIWSVFQMHKLAQYPIEIYNKFVRILISFILPFAFASYFPTLDYLFENQNNLFFIVPCITITVWIIVIITWNWALKQYRSTGN